MSDEVGVRYSSSYDSRISFYEDLGDQICSEKPGDLEVDLSLELPGLKVDLVPDPNDDFSSQDGYL